MVAEAVPTEATTPLRVAVEVETDETEEVPRVGGAPVTVTVAVAADEILPEASIAQAKAACVPVPLNVNEIGVAPDQLGFVELGVDDDSVMR
jgi:hypothetical protein